MTHSVWNLGSLGADARVQPRQFIAGIEPARDIFIGRNREPKKMLVILNAWLELNDHSVTQGDEFTQGKFSLALGKEPLTTALLLPVGAVRVSAGAEERPLQVEQLFHAQGWMGAVKQIAIDFQEDGVVTVDADVHMDWTVAPTDWWTWFASWDSLEAFPDGSLVDGERAYP